MSLLGQIAAGWRLAALGRPGLDVDAEAQRMSAFGERYALAALSAEEPRGVRVPPAWAAPVAGAIAALVETASDEGVAGAELLAMIERVADGAAGLIEDMDVDALAEALEAGMGQAALAGAMRGTAERRVEQKDAKEAKGSGARDARAEAALRSVVTFAAGEVEQIVSDMGLVAEPLEKALQRLDRKGLLATRMGSADLARLPAAIRERAQFSAHVESARLLAGFQGKLRSRLSMEREALANGKAAFVDRSSFIADMRELARDAGVVTAGPGEQGGLRDITSAKRLGLIWDVQTTQAAEYTRAQMGLDRDVLDEFPAWRFVRISEVQTPRDWHAQFEGAVRLKTDVAFWTRVNRDFGVPWGPWGWGCGHDVEDVDREEAEALGLVESGAAVPGQEEARDFNQGLEAGIAEVADPELRGWLAEELGERIEIEGDTVRWLG